MTNILISVIIPVYNSSLLIKRCLTSILNQETEYQIEIILIDDGSTDNSIEVAQNISKEIKIISQSNQGPAAARNKGINESRGKYIAFIDADDYWMPDFLFKTVNFLENNSGAIAVSVGQKHIIPGKTTQISPAFLTQYHTSVEPILLPDFYEFWAINNHVCSGSVLMLAEVVKKTGGQRTDLLITEDLEFWAYLATFGSWGFIPEVLLVTDGGKMVKINGYIKKNRKRWKNAPSIEDWEKRIIPNINMNQYSSFILARGRIAKNLIYSYIQSFRLRLANQTVKKYHKNFPKGKDTSIYLICSKTGFPFWFAISVIFIFREYYKSIKFLMNEI